MSLANFIRVMNTSDFLIIYLACGAPFAVYFFLQNRKNLSPRMLWLKSFLTVFVWIPYAFLLLNDFATKKSRAGRENNNQASSNEKLREIQKQLLDLQLEAERKISPFEFREILERYAGLTNFCNFEDKAPSAAEREIFRIALRKNTGLAANCLHRRNRQRLLFHQTLARKDFLQIITKLKFSVINTEKLSDLAINFVEILNDPEAKESLAGIFNETLQNKDKISVRELETVVWKSKEQKPLTANQTPIHLQALRAATTAAAANKKD